MARHPPDKRYIVGSIPITGTNIMESFVTEKIMVSKGDNGFEFVDAKPGYTDLYKKKGIHSIRSRQAIYNSRVRRKPVTLAKVKFIDGKD